MVVICLANLLFLDVTAICIFLFISIIKWQLCGS